MSELTELVTAEVSDPEEVQRLSRAGTAALSQLGEAVTALRDLDHERTAPASLARLLATLGLRAGAFDDLVARLAPHTASPLADLAGDVTDAAETLATRWDGLVPSRRESLLDVLVARRPALEALLGAMAQSTTTGDHPESITARATPARPPRPRSPQRDPGKAWEAWSQEPAGAGHRELFLDLSRSWIEGTGAQLLRNARSSSAVRSNATELTERVRHHLIELAATGTVPYKDALAIARQRVIDELEDPPPTTTTPATPN